MFDCPFLRYEHIFQKYKYNKCLEEIKCDIVWHVLVGNSVFGMAVDELHGYIYYGDHDGIMQGMIFGTSKKMIVTNAGKSGVTWQHINRVPFS